MTGRGVRWAVDVAVTAVLAFLVALSAGRIVAWFRWVVAWPDDRQQWWAVIPALGAILSLAIVALARVSPATADAYAHGLNRDRLEIGPAPARFAALATGVGVGAPLGYEGPMVYFGGSLGAWVARRLRRPERWCVLASATAAVAMVIGAPIAGALFASEVARRGLPSRRDRLPLILGAGAAWSARRLTGEAGGILGTDPGLASARVAVGALGIGAAAAVVGRGFVWAIRRVKDLHLPVAARVLVVALTLGAAVPLGWWATGDAIFLGSGERLGQWAIGAAQPTLLLATLVFAALVVAMIGAGLVGGLFLPILALGSMMGVLLGRAWLPDVPLVACVGIGACCLLAGAYGATFTAIAIAFATFGWSSTAWLAVAGVLVATAGRGDRSVSTYQLPWRVVGPRGGGPSRPMSVPPAG